jgi:hypothetical protein
MDRKTRYYSSITDAIYPIIPVDDLEKPVRKTWPKQLRGETLYPG